jgi:transaldolase
VERKLDPAIARNSKIDKLHINEKNFRWLFNEDAMATEKLSEGIRIFHADALKLKKYIAEHL